MTADVFGKALLEWARGDTTPEVVEREDGFTQIGAGREVYLSRFAGWPAAERQSLRHVRGRVVDVGCGAGRVALELELRGFDVVGLDASSRAIEAATLRGLSNVWRASIDDLGRKIDSFDSVVLYGNNFGLFETPERARALLSEWAVKSRPFTRLFLESTSAYFGGAPGMDRSYYRRNRELGRPPGTVRLRYRYDDEVGGWFTWLFVSPREMRSILRGTGWRQTRVLSSRTSEPYVAVVERG
ncbi:MAG: methyltransferase domain-containing protein [Acidimicrobiales bacterium]